MTQSLIRRFLYALLLLGIISIIAFWLSRQVPGDVVEDYLSIDDRRSSSVFNPVEHRRVYARVAQMRGLDLPPFYISVYPALYPDAVFDVLPYEDRSALKKWIARTGSGTKSLELYHTLKTEMDRVCNTSANDQYHEEACLYYHRSLSEAKLERINNNATTLLTPLLQDTIVHTGIKSGLSSVIEKSSILSKEENRVSLFRALPVVRWNGSQNQYHQWMSGLLLQKPLTSLVDGRNAWSKIYEALKWTLLLNGLAFVLALALGIGIGIWSGTNDGRAAEKYMNWFLFALFAIPSFWLGTLFIYLFASGEWLRLFPAGGLGSHPIANSFTSKWSIITYHLFLPVMCLTLGTLAYISRQMKRSILHEMEQPYVGALRAQGISEKTIVRRHVIRNALFPVITMIAGAIPALLSGSLIIEVIFSIPGMGRLMYNSLLSRDWPVAFPVLMLVACVTVVSYILTDIVYRWVDPRVKTISS